MRRSPDVVGGWLGHHRVVVRETSPGPENEAHRDPPGARPPRKKDERHVNHARHPRLGRSALRSVASPPIPRPDIQHRPAAHHQIPSSPAS